LQQFVQNLLKVLMLGKINNFHYNIPQKNKPCFFSKTEIDDMIRKPTNLLLTKTLKSALVELTAAESETQLNFSQVKFLFF
jgi:hypothetical protein